MNISKELLSEVLGLKYPIRIIHHFCKGQNVLNYDLHVECALFEESINIHELANKCKEWAFKNRCTLKSYLDYQDGKWSVEVYPNKRGMLYAKTADTEPEAIFKACEWIKDNK